MLQEPGDQPISDRKCQGRHATAVAILCQLTRHAQQGLGSADGLQAQSKD
jgi:hypothetical protein